MIKKKLVLGTRGSKLALIQAETVKRKINSIFPHHDIRIQVIKTKGDAVLDLPLSEINDKGLFVKELDQALIDETIDFAVHSLKDVPSEIPSQLILGGIIERSEVRDVLISRYGKNFMELSPGARIATSSVRRRSQLFSLRKDLRIIDIRGNIDTRIKKMEESFCDALVLAGAGVIRAGYTDKITEYFDPDIMIPAPNQGVIGIVVKKDSLETVEILRSITSKQAMRMACAERVFLHTLQGGCKVPIGCLSSIEENTFKINGFLGNLDGSIFIKKEFSGPEDQSREISKRCAEWIIAHGGRNILDGIRRAYYD